MPARAAKPVGVAHARAECGTKFSGAGQCAATTGMALRLEKDIAGGGGCVASSREVGAGGGVVKAAVPGETENEDLRAVQKAKAST